MVRADDPEVVWDEPNEVDDKWTQTIDDNVLVKLPEGTRPLGIHRCGSSYWTKGAEISTEQSDGSEMSFFLKVTLNKEMVSGEFVSQSTLHSAVPDFTPKPYAWGTYAADPKVHFFLCAFVDMDEMTLPDPQKFARGLAKLHRTTVSPTGKYGFPVSTLHGNLAQYTEWTDTWEEFFSRSFKTLMEHETRAQGPDLEMQHLEEATLRKVIPRLLRPLETGGRSIRPCLVHGDLWDGNVATDLETNNPVIFDACCTYAHNEYELAPLRPVRHRMRKEYVEAYFNVVHPSEPGEDYDDRNALYCLRFDMNSSSLYPGRTRWRKICIETMQYLVAKYPGGSNEAFELLRAESLVHDDADRRLSAQRDTDSSEPAI